MLGKVSPSLKIYKKRVKGLLVYIKQSLTVTTDTSKNIKLVLRFLRHFQIAGTPLEPKLLLLQGNL
jgi:hypothetical protein